MSDEPQNIPLSQQAMGVQPRLYLDGLNPAQREAVEQLEGSVLMLAGAGTGKTRALTARIAHLLHTGTARSHEILAVTFTNKAAREMKNRVENLLGGIGEAMPWLGTFHSLSAKLLRRHAELAGLQGNFTILDSDDQMRLLKQIISAYNIDEKRWPARFLAGLIDTWKNHAWLPDQVPDSDDTFDGKGKALYKIYQQRLKTLNAVDFGDLILHIVTILQTNPELLQKYQNWFRYILVDEYQDTNAAQYLWLRLFAQHQNICCVGDDDQSIYGWRGAQVGNILRFERDFAGAKVIRLEQNYRSTQHILSAAGGIIEHNVNRLGKTLWTARGDGEKLHLIGHWDGETEARWMGDQIEAYQNGTGGRDPFSLDDMAILVRASHQMRAFEDRFLSIGLPYRVIGGPRFYERMEIRDAMAYLRLVVSTNDDLAFERIINVPRRGLGDKALQRINVLARERDIPLFMAAQDLAKQGVLRGKANQSLRQFCDAILRWHSVLHDRQISHIELAEMILDESGYTGHWQNDKSPDALGRLENLKELIKALEGFENLEGFLEHISLVMENEQGANAAAVSIMTLHAAKGLEFPIVFLPGWEDGLFPSQRALDETGDSGLEEERRLAYVGITRAKAICTISFANNRLLYGKWQSAIPSRFIDELPKDHVEVLTPPSGLYAGAAQQAAPSGLAQITSEGGYNSPGFQRMAMRMSGKASANRPMSKIVSSHVFELNERVHHSTFGFGTVVGAEGDKLSILFDGKGAKKVMASHIEKADDVPF